VLYGAESPVEANNSLGVQEIHRCVRNPKIRDRIQNFRVLEFIIGLFIQYFLKVIIYNILSSVHVFPNCSMEVSM
jgi:hypothetical protein